MPKSGAALSDMPCLIWGTMSFVGILAAPVRPLLSIMILLSLLLYFRDPHFKCSRMPVMLSVS